MFLFSFPPFHATKTCVKRCATAVSNSIDRIWHGSGTTTFVTI